MAELRSTQQIWYKLVDGGKYRCVPDLCISYNSIAAVTCLCHRLISRDSLNSWIFEFDLDHRSLWAISEWPAGLRRSSIRCAGHHHRLNLYKNINSSQLVSNVCLPCLLPRDLPTVLNCVEVSGLQKLFFFVFWFYLNFFLKGKNFFSSFFFNESYI